MTVNTAQKGPSHPNLLKAAYRIEITPTHVSKNHIQRFEHFQLTIKWTELECKNIWETKDGISTVDVIK